MSWLHNDKYVLYEYVSAWKRSLRRAGRGRTGLRDARYVRMTSASVFNTPSYPSLLSVTIYCFKESRGRQILSHLILVMEKLIQTSARQNKWPTRKKKTGHHSFSQAIFSPSLCLHLDSHGLMPPTLFHISLKLQTLVQLCSVSAQKNRTSWKRLLLKLHQRWGEVPKQTSIQSNINATTWWSASFGFPQVCVTQPSPSGEEPSVCPSFGCWLKSAAVKIHCPTRIFSILHPLKLWVAANLSTGQQHKQIQMYLITSSISSTHCP